MANKKEFIICPLPLIKNLMADGNTVEDIFQCGILYRAMHVSTVFPERAKREFIKSYFKEKEALTPELLKLGDEVFKAEKFKGKDMYPIDLLVNMAEEDLDIYLMDTYCNTFPDMLKIWYQCNTMCEKLNFPPCYILNLIENREKWFDEKGVCKMQGCPTFLCNYDTMVKLFFERDELTESRRVLWTMYFAIMSIIGTKKYVGTTSQMIKTRLAGAKSKDELADVLASMTDEQRALYEKYTTIRRYNYMMEDLKTSNMIVEYGAGRKTYVTVKLTLDQLCEQVMTGTRAGKNKILKMKKDQAEAEVKARLEQRYKPRIA